jgi:hypothetical protein
MAERRVGLLQACDDPQLFAFELWPLQRALLEAVEAGPRIHAWALGRRSGKSLLASVVCLWDCTLRPELDAMVRPGETRFAVAMATNLNQARLIVRGARSIVERSPLLAEMVAGSTEDEIRFTLPSGAKTALRAFPCSSRGARGWPISTLALDEAAHFLTETEGDRTAEMVWKALSPSTAQFADRARLLVLSTPWGTSGLFAELWERTHAGEFEDAAAHKHSTQEVNPTIPAEFLAMEERRDPEMFRSEYLAEFLGSGDAFLDFDRFELVGAPTAGPKDAQTWVAGLDPAFSRDPFGLALVGRTAEGQLVVGPVRALDAQGGFAAPVDEVAEVVREYNATAVTDQFCAAATAERLRQEHGVHVRVNTMTPQSKTSIFQELRVKLYDGSLVLPDHPALINELRRLRTKYTAGSAAILNPRVGGSHGDMAQAVAMAVGELATAAHVPTAQQWDRLVMPQTPWHAGLQGRAGE